MPLAGHDPLTHIHAAEGEDFNPRAPCGARRYLPIPAVCLRPRFQSTCPLRGTTLYPFYQILPGKISIHVPLAGHDRSLTIMQPNPHYFNPRAPCGARLVARHCRRGKAGNFNPRAPCGARPHLRICRDRPGVYFNPRAPCGARPRDMFQANSYWGISIHVPLAGHDPRIKMRRP